MDYNTVLNLNSIIYDIYNTENFDTMKESVLRLVRILIPCTCVSIMINDGIDTPNLTQPLIMPESFAPLEQTYMKLQKNDGSLWVLYKKQSTVFRDTDLMPDDKRIHSDYYEKCLKPFGLHYSVDMTITDGDRMIGIMTLYRTKAEGDFTGDEMSLLKLLSDHLNARFSKEYSTETASSSSQSISKFISNYDLTNREAEVLQMVFDGMENSEIEEALCISPFTLKKHLQNLYRKTGVSGRVQLKALG